MTVSGTGGPILRTGAGVPGYSGLVTCGSPHSCPVCAPKVAAGRAGDLAVILEKVHTENGCAYMVTLTMRHHGGHRLGELWPAVAKAWAAVTGGRDYARERAGQLGWCKITEATYGGRNGWHLHVHALLTWDHEVDEDAAQRVVMAMWRRWDAQLRRDGFDSTPVFGVHAERVRPGDDGAAEYFAKAAWELTSPSTKDSRVGRSPFAILRDAVEFGRPRDIELWREWEQASFGRAQMTWSLGDRDLRVYAGVKDRSDEEIVTDEAGGDDQIGLAREAWAEIGGTAGSDELLEVTGRDGIVAATEWLDARGAGLVPGVGSPA